MVLVTLATPCPRCFNAELIACPLSSLFGVDCARNHPVTKTFSLSVSGDAAVKALGRSAGKSERRMELTAAVFAGTASFFWLSAAKPALGGADRFSFRASHSKQRCFASDS